MRLTFLFVLALITSSTFAQTVSYGNFKLLEQEIIYQKINTLDSVTVTKLEEYYKTLPYISNLETKGDGLQFDINDISVDYKKFQFTQVNTPSILQTGKFSGKATVGVKDGRYRITIKSIQLTGNLGYKMITEKDNLTRYASKNSGTVMAEDWCRPNMLGLLDKAFNDKLELKNTDGDW